MTRSKAYTKAQAKAFETRKDHYVVYDPTATDDPKQYAFFVASEEDLETYFYGITPIATICPV